jgi:hypothetical protein
MENAVAHAQGRKRAARETIARLRKQSDATIDYSDIPPLGEDFFRTAEWLMPAGKSKSRRKK